jgi:SAM-dependent methyltransferase
LANGYRNARYGTRLAPASKAGHLLARLLPPLGWPVDATYRYLPRRRPSEEQRVLDIGCGNGDWLALIQETGWQAGGVEPDAIAAAQARDRGFDVRSSVEDWLDSPGSFDFVTMSHVIEHVHDPISLLRAAYDLLRPGGRIFLATPNIDAIGHSLYGRHWRGLEPPRHLVLFNRTSLSAALSRAGFSRVSFPRRFYPFKEMCDQSRRIQAGHDPYGTTSENELSSLPGLLQSARAMAGTRTEFLTALAVRPE